MSAAPDTEELITRAAGGDTEAEARLLGRHRDRLSRMVAVRLDRRLAARIDPSDVVQEALTDAVRKFPEYVTTRPLPFYPWLRRLALERLVKLHRRHIYTDKRSVGREAGDPQALPDESVVQLVAHLVAPGATQISEMAHAEMCRQVRATLDRLDGHHREVLVMRYLEGMPTREIAAALEIGEGAVKMRHLRALERIRPLLERSLERREA